MYTQQQSDRRDAKGKAWGKVMELSCSFHTPHSVQISLCSPTQEFSKDHPFGFLGRLHYIGMNDYIIACWPLIQSPVPFTFWEVRRAGLKVPTF